MLVLEKRGKGGGTMTGKKIPPPGGEGRGGVFFRERLSAVEGEEEDDLYPVEDHHLAF